MSEIQRSYDIVHRGPAPVKIAPLYLRHMEAGRRSLDVGTGTGEVPLLLRQGGREAYGVDFSREGIARGRAEARRRGLDPDLLVLADMSRGLPFRGGVFDVVGSHDVAMYVTDPRAWLTEMVRVARPGGNVVLHAPNASTPFVNADRYLPSPRKFAGFWGPYLRTLSGLPVEARRPGPSPGFLDCLPTGAGTPERGLVRYLWSAPELHTYVQMGFVLGGLFREAGLRNVSLRTWNMHGPREWPGLLQPLAYGLFDVLDRLPVARQMGHGIMLVGEKPRA